MYLTKPDKGWAWLVLVASFLEHCIAGFCMYAVGLFHITILGKFNKSVTFTSWLCSIFLWLLSFSGPLASLLIDRWSCRVTMVTGSLLMTTGLAVSAFANDIFTVMVFFSIVGGVGIGLAYNAAYMALAFNFDKKRNVATGIASSGCGIGAFVLAPVFQIIHQTYEYNGFFLLLGGLSLQACVLGAILRPSYLETSAKTDRRNRKNTGKSLCNCDLTVVKNISILCVGFGGFFFNIGIFMIYLHFPKYAMENGSVEADVSWFLSLAGICSCIGRLLVGMASNSDNINEDIVFFGSYVLLGLFTVCLPLVISIHSAKIVYVIILGTYSGTCYAVINTIVLKLVGPSHVAQGTGYVMAFIGVGSLVGPPLGGLIVDNGGTYDTSFIVSGFALILGGFLELVNVIFKTEQCDLPSTKEFEFKTNDINESKDFEGTPYFIPESEKEYMLNK